MKRASTLDRRGFLAGVAALALTQTGSAAEPAAAPAPLRLRVLTYNIHHGEGLDHKLDLDRIAAVIRKAEPDLVALQEVDRATTRTGQVDQAAKLGELTKMHAAFGQAMAFAGGGYGNAILSRHKLEDPVTHQLPGAPAEEPRCLLEATIRFPAGDRARAVRFGATHFNHRNAAERLGQARAIVGDRGIFSQPRVPTILAGDLNARPDSEEIRLVTASFVDASARRVPAREQKGSAAAPAAAAQPATEEMLTSPANTPRSKIDYILVAPAAAWKVVRAEVIPEAVASDHRPVMVELELAE